MTNDALNASVAAALVQANLQFTTGISSAGEPGETQVRTFQLEFAFREGSGKCLVTGYVAGVVLVALSPVRIGDPEKRHEIADALVYRMPMVRLLPPAPGHPEQDVAWVEASVPVPPAEHVAAPTWMLVPVFMGVVSAVEHIIQAYSEHASIPEPPPQPFLLSTDRQGTGVMHAPAPAA